MESEECRVDGTEWIARKACVGDDFAQLVLRRRREHVRGQRAVCIAAIDLTRNDGFSLDAWMQQPSNESIFFYLYTHTHTYIRIIVFVK